CKVPRSIKTEALHMEIIEIGAVLLDETYKEIDSFKTYIKPQYGFVDEFIKNLTGITVAETKNAPETKQALEMFTKWIPDDAVLVTWSENDEHQLRREMEYKNIDIPKLNRLLDEYIDSQLDFSDIMDSDRQYSLYEALVLGDIDFDEDIHDALVDARNTALLFAKMETEEEFKFISYYSK
ncbi:MAG: exonuclease domain-containing protein, partial [Firmicutes bacterium]|nr:exonuclease domain-containing protein [Bacillota bacterium]